MQTTTSLWKKIFREVGHTTEVKAVVDGVTYGIDKLFTITQNRATYNATNPTIGACTSSTLELELIPESRVPRMATIVLSNRLVSADGTEQSEWLPAGTFYVDTRSKEREGMTLVLTAYDAMLKADQPYLENSELSSWPSPDDDVVDEIADLMGITVDSRTVLAGYDVPIPEQDWTMREVLGWIAAANGGNWVITPENKLLLVKFEGITSLLGTDSSHALLLGDSLIVLSTGIKYEDTRSLLGDDSDSAIKFGSDFVVLNVNRNRDGGYYPTDGQDIQKNAHSLQNLGLLQPFTGVKLWRSHETTYEDQEVTHTAGTAIMTEIVRVEVEQSVMAGTDDGRVLEADCPWATQAMATAILAQIDGYCWQGAVVEGAEITPAAELGDPVICDGVAFPLSSLSVTYDGAYAPTISAPADEEVDYEYHYESEVDRKINRKVSIGENYYGFKVTRENGIEVSNIVDGVSTTRMILNSNEQKFFDADGNLALYFDPVARKYKFMGDVIVAPGYHIRSSALGILAESITEAQAEALTIPSGFNLYDKVNDAPYNFLRIYYYGLAVHFESPAGGNAYFTFDQVDFNSPVFLNYLSKYPQFSGNQGDDEIATVGYVKSLTVHPIIITQPTDITAVAGTSVTASIVAARATGYQWYYRAAGATTWNASTTTSGKSANYTFTANAAYNGRQIYCEVKNQYGSTYSDIITLTVVQQ